MINDTPSANDVLIGRGRGILNHPGNQKYQSIIKYLKPEYDAAPKSLKGVLYGNQIINIIHDLCPPGRFLKEDKVSGSWIEVDHEEAVKRARQALRDTKKLVRTPAQKALFPAGEVVAAAASTPGALITNSLLLIQQYDGFQEVSTTLQAMIQAIQGSL
jgi:hypothetical protein